MLDKLRGIQTPAWLTGALRGVLESVAFAALYGGYAELFNITLPENYKWVLFAAPFVLRSAEGTIDHIDPLKARRRAAADKVQ